MAPRAETGETDPREKRESQGKGSGACRAFQGNWGLRETEGSLGLQDQRARKEIMEAVQHDLGSADSHQGLSTGFHTLPGH